MTAVAYWFADLVWWTCLWVMRRPAIQALQKRTVGRTERSWRMHVRQNRFSLLYGRRIVRVIMLLFLAYVVVVFAYAICMEMLTRGWLSLPDSVKNKAGYS